MFANLLLTAALTLQPPAALPTTTAMETPPAPEQVMVVPAELRDLLRRQVIDPTHSRRRQLDHLADFLFSEDGLHIQYDQHATYTVEQAFRWRKANCLTLTLLAIALSREIGLEAYGQEIDRVLSRDVDDGVITQSIHVNAGIVVGGRHFVIDVSTDDLLAATLPRRISDERLLALYYNNRAMELMAQGHLTDADLWLRIAMRHAPDHPMLWNNAGVLHLRNGRNQDAKSAFHQALQLDPKHPPALFNLVAFYHRTGDAPRAAEWRQRADRLLRDDPFHQFQRGQQSEQRGDYAMAMNFYRRAIRLDKKQHLFHFGLARALLHLGRYDTAGAELRRAHELGDPAIRGSYQAKLEALRRLQSNR